MRRKKSGPVATRPARKAQSSTRTITGVIVPAAGDGVVDLQNPVPRPIWSCVQERFPSNEGGPRGHHPRSRRRDRVATDTTKVLDAGVEVVDLAPYRQLPSWAATVLYLHSLGLPAPVPPDVARWLRRRGIRPDWEYPERAA